MKRKLLALVAGVTLAGSVSAAAFAYPSPDTMVTVGWNSGLLTYSYQTGSTVTPVTGTVPVSHPGGGEINHGTVVSSLAKALKGIGYIKGCLMKLVAQADFPATTTGTTPLSVTCGPSVGSAETSAENGPPAHVLAKRALRATWTPGSGPPPWAGGEDG